MTFLLKFKPIPKTFQENPLTELAGSRTFHKQSPACDMYSVGIILWEIATCESPYGAEADSVIKAAVSEGQRLDIPADVPNHYRDLIAACWEHEVSKRIVAKEALRRAKHGQLMGQSGCNG